MKLVAWMYKKIKKKEPPYYLKNSIFTIIMKPIRKWVTNVVAAKCPFNCIRILLYRMCGFKIGKKVFIGMRCYLDDMCRRELIIGNNVTISYGVFFACHGKNQKHLPIVVGDNVYIGMRASIISKNSVTQKKGGVHIGEHATIGACALVNKDIPPYATAVGIPCRIIESNKNNE